jgi:hypothetical protein
MASRTKLQYSGKQLLNMFSSCVYISPQHTTGGAAKDVTSVATLIERVKPRIERATRLWRRAATPVPVPLQQCVVQRSARVTQQDGRDVRGENSIPTGATAGALAGAAGEVAKQKMRNLFHQKEAGPLLQVVSVATPGEGAASYLGGQPTVGAEQDVGIIVEQVAHIVPPRIIVADRIQPIQLSDADEPTAHVVLGVLQLACMSTRIKQRTAKGTTATQLN